MSDLDPRDLLAAEYVLGTLDVAERTAVAALMVDDPDFLRAVQDWERRLAPLVVSVPDVLPPAELYGQVVARLFGPADAVVSHQAMVALRRSVRRWRAAASGMALLAASIAGWVVVRDRLAPQVGAGRLTAVLQRDAGSPAMVIDVDPATRRLTIRPVSAVSPPGKSFELWIIDPALGAPRSLGLVPPRTGAGASLTAYDEDVISGAVYAVTLEPVGGSPTGQPTGSPILTGKLFPAPP